MYFSAPKTFLLFSQKNVISRLVIDNDDLDPDIPEVVLPIPQLRNIKGLAYDPVDNYIYWIEGKHNVIKRSTDNGTHVSMSTGYTPKKVNRKWYTCKYVYRIHSIKGQLTMVHM